MPSEDFPGSVPVSAMSWFQTTTNFATLAKSALREAQKTIDKALDIRDDSSAPAAAAPVPSECEETEDHVDDVALTESEIQMKDGSPPETPSPHEIPVTVQSECNATSVISVSSLNNSIVSTDDPETRWSTIEIDAVENSHSRNSSISTIPDTNSTSSPERDVAQCRNVSVNENVNTVYSSAVGALVLLPETCPETAVEGSTQQSVDSTSSVNQPTGENSQSSSSFEHVIPNTVDPVPKDDCMEGFDCSPVINNSHSPVATPSNFNKLVTKVKTTASSASSSDIEVIPLDPEEQQPFSKILQEAETQTDETMFKIMKPEKTKSSKADEKVVAQLEEKLKEKDSAIEQLLEEGQKLSKKQFELSNVVKKLRLREKEQENSIKAVKSELAEKSVELERLMKVFVNKEGVEQSQNEQISRLNSENRKLESEIERLKSELEDAVENCNSMKVSLENTSLEILEAKNIILATQRDALELDRLTKEKSELFNRSETLQKEVEHLRSVVNETQKESSNLELQLKSQLAVMTSKCHQLENELSDISSEIADATMPLSLEIEKLQQEIKSNQLSAQKRESALQTQVSDLEHRLKVAMEREMTMNQVEQSSETTVRSLESRLDEIEDENKQLRSSLRESKANHDADMKSYESRLSDALSEIDQLKQANQTIQSELRSEQAEKKKLQQMLEQQTRSNSQLVPVSSTLVTPSGSQNYFDAHPALTSSSSSTLTSTSQVGTKNQTGHRSGENSPSSQSILSEVSYLDEVFDSNGQNMRSLTPKSFFESFSSANVIESLHGQLRLREGELNQYIEEAMKNEKIRKSLNEEIAQLTIQNQELLLQTEKLTELQSRLEELEKNYNAVLQMYGEKVEEAEELRLDLQDVKKMYKDQINELMKRESC